MNHIAFINCIKIHDINDTIKRLKDLRSSQDRGHCEVEIKNLVDCEEMMTGMKDY